MYMKETLRSEIWHGIVPGKKFIFYPEPGLEGIVGALRHILLGRQVMVAYPDDLSREDAWWHIPTFPSDVLCLLHTIPLRRRLLAWSSLAPHLFRPVQSIITGKVISSGWMKMSDLLLGNDFHKRSHRVVLDAIPGFGELPDTCKQAWLFQETMVNVSRLKIELLREIYTQGGIILNHAEWRADGKNLLITDKLTGELFATDISEMKKYESIFQEVFTLPGLPWDEFSMHLLSGESFMTLWDHNGAMRISPWPSIDMQQVSDFLETLSIKVTSENVVAAHIPREIDLFRKNMPQELTTLRVKNAVGGQDERHVEEIMETAYDQAKQTGIRFRPFRKLFYSYGAATNWITERAYEAMLETRDPAIIWKKAEENFQVNYEWRVT